MNIYGTNIIIDQYGCTQAMSRASPEGSLACPMLGTREGLFPTFSTIAALCRTTSDETFQTPSSRTLSRSEDPLSAVCQYDVDKEDGEQKNGEKHWQ
jgi:hypothetical protein